MYFINSTQSLKVVEKTVSSESQKFIKIYWKPKNIKLFHMQEENAAEEQWSKFLKNQQNGKFCFNRLINGYKQSKYLHLDNQI